MGSGSPLTPHTSHLHPHTFTLTPYPIPLQSAPTNTNPTNLTGFSPAIPSSGISTHTVTHPTGSKRLSKSPITDLSTRVHIHPSHHPNIHPIRPHLTPIRPYPGRYYTHTRETGISQPSGSQRSLGVSKPDGGSE